ncbi:hypothetical protein EI94DRAFT_866632 [Lactarius quietus]|nr:hypothetical protein EI94DRAFT_866632 [Lactarius quietus]
MCLRSDLLSVRIHTPCDRVSPRSLMPPFAPRPRIPIYIHPACPGFPPPSSSPHRPSPLLHPNRTRSWDPTPSTSFPSPHPPTRHHRLRGATRARPRNGGNSRWRMSSYLPSCSAGASWTMCQSSNGSARAIVHPQQKDMLGHATIRARRNSFMCCSMRSLSHYSGPGSTGGHATGSSEKRRRTKKREKSLKEVVAVVDDDDKAEVEEKEKNSPTSRGQALATAFT